MSFIKVSRVNFRKASTVKIRAIQTIIHNGRLVDRILDREPRRNSNGKIIERYATITTRRIK